MRVVVTGKSGQLATAISEIGPTQGVDVLLAGRPELDLVKANSVLPALESLSPDIIVNAAAYTGVDAAEDNPELAQKVNAEGAGAVAKAATALGIPVIHVSTDYVFEGSKQDPYLETDETGPLGVYGNSKLAGEIAVRKAAPSNHVIARTAWVYSPFGQNFLKTMLRVGATRDSLTVVADQFGCPTSAHDLAIALLQIARNLHVTPNSDELYGTFHVSGSGDASWAEFAEEIFKVSAELGGPVATVTPIPSTAYPTRARRPQNSRLNSNKLNEAHNIRLPDWKTSTREVIQALLTSGHETATNT